MAYVEDDILGDCDGPLFIDTQEAMKEIKHPPVSGGFDDSANRTGAFLTGRRITRHFAWETESRGGIQRALEVAQSHRAHQVQSEASSLDTTDYKRTARLEWPKGDITHFGSSTDTGRRWETDMEWTSTTVDGELLMWETVFLGMNHAPILWKIRKAL